MSLLSVDFAAPVFFYLPDFKENFKLMCSSFCMFSRLPNIMCYLHHLSTFSRPSACIGVFVICLFTCITLSVLVPGLGAHVLSKYSKSGATSPAYFCFCLGKAPSQASRTSLLTTAPKKSSSHLIIHTLLVLWKHLFPLWHGT
ncbi:uncharacterized protein LOC144316412 isoform X2 [Canis aureus]